MAKGFEVIIPYLQRRNKAARGRFCGALGKTLSLSAGFSKKDLTNRRGMDIIINNIMKTKHAAMGSNSAFALRTESRRVVRGGGGARESLPGASLPKGGAACVSKRRFGPVTRPVHRVLARESGFFENCPAAKGRARHSGAAHTERPCFAANGVVPQSAVLAFVSGFSEAKAFLFARGKCKA